jgi:hypothetical protein
LVLLAIALRGVGYALLTPTYEGWDEYQHLGYMASMLDGGRLVDGKPVMPPSVMRDVVNGPVPGALAKQAPASRMQTYREHWIQPAEGVDCDVPLYESQHAPWYYIVHSPLLHLAVDERYSFTVRALRLANLGWLLLAVWSASAVLRNCGVGSYVSNTAIALLSVHPLFVMANVRVANDAMAMALFTAAIAWATRRPESSLDKSGALIAVSGAVKATAWTLVPAAVVLLLMRRISRHSATIFVLHIIAVVGVVAALEIGRQGRFAPTQEAMILAEQGKGIRDVIAAVPTIDWAREFTRRWGRELLWVGGWSFVPLPKILPRIHQWLLAASFVMLLWRLWKRGIPANRAFAAFCVLCCLGIAAGQALHMAQSKAALGFVATPAWYAVIALPWLFAGLAWSWGFDRRVQRGMTAVFFTLLLVSEAVGVFLCWLPTFADSSDPTVVIERCSKLAGGPGFFWIGCAGFGFGWIAACLAMRCAIRKETA